MTAEPIAAVVADLRAHRTHHPAATDEAGIIYSLKAAQRAAAPQPVVDCTAVFRATMGRDSVALYEDFPEITPPWDEALLCYVNTFGNVIVLQVHRQPIAAGSWAAVRALVDDRVTPRLRAEIEDVLAQRREHTPRYDPAETRRDWTDADWAAEFARQDVRADIECRCYDLAARVWDRLRPARPVVPDEQLSLFDLAGAL